MQAMQIVFHYLDWVALTLGTIGTALWAHNGAWAKYASLWWLASSLAWISYAYTTQLMALGVRDLIAVVFYLYGGYRYLRSGQPKSEADKAV